MELVRNCTDKSSLHTIEKSMLFGCWKLHYGSCRLSHVKLSTLGGVNREIGYPDKSGKVSDDRIIFCSGKGKMFIVDFKEHIE
jgi:hypothetical protein